MVAAAYERGSGINMAAYGEIDDVIDPADSRRWIATLFDEDSGRWWTRARQEAPVRGRLVGPEQSLVAVLAGAAQHHLVVLDASAQPLGDLVDRPLQRGVVERDQPPAAVAHEVMVVLARRVGHLVAGDAVAEVEPLDQLVVVEQLERAVHARAADRALARGGAAQRVLDLQRAECAVLAREQLDQPFARRALVMARRAGARRVRARPTGPMTASTLPSITPPPVS